LCRNPKTTLSNLKVFAVEPEASPVISGGAPGPHPLQGIAGFIPTNLYTELLDGAIQVSKDEAYDFTQSSQRGRNVSWNFFRCFLSGGRKKLSEIPENAKVLTFATILENTI
jgi:cysteine synthase A